MLFRPPVVLAIMISSLPEFNSIPWHRLEIRGMRAFSISSVKGIVSFFILRVCGGDPLLKQGEEPHPPA